MLSNNGAPMTPTLIVTRPAAQGTSFAADIAARWGGDLLIIQSPLLKIMPVAVQVNQPDAVIFTSANGVTCAEALLLPRGIPAWCVGAKTAQIARDAGFDPITGPGDAQGLVDEIIAAAPKGRMAHIRGQHARGDIATQLNAAGLRCEDVVAYHQSPLPLSPQARLAIAATEPLIFPLFSPRTAAILNKQGPFVAPVYVVALSEAVKDVVDRHIVTAMHVATRPDNAAMIDKTIAVMKELVPRR